jgi:hypothetical protein
MPAEPAYQGVDEKVAAVMRVEDAEWDGEQGKGVVDPARSLVFKT